jgi:hypothetical protein
MKIRIINWTIGSGIIVFLTGFIIGIHWIKYFQILMSVGFLITSIGIFYFFKDTNLTEQFRKDRREDILTYFWNVLFFNVETFIFVVWMITMNLILIFDGFQ